MQPLQISPDQHPHTLGDKCFVKSYAKINLTLDVLGKRTDGYHDLVTLMQTIDLYDTICLTATDEDKVQINCTRPELNSETNLAARAIEAVRQHLSLTRGVMIELYKRIPVAAGLGGGSSNAAAALLAIRQWWQLPLSPSEMLAIAASLGSDVPFFLVGGLALCEGRGERVTPLAPHWPASMCWLLLLKPSLAISTGTVFRSLLTKDYTEGKQSRAICLALQKRSSFSLENMHNSLERCVLEQYPEVAQAKADLLYAGASFVRLSGSGSTLFAPFAHVAHAARAQQHLQAQGYEVYLTRAIHPDGKHVHLF